MKDIVLPPYSILFYEVTPQEKDKIGYNDLGVGHIMAINPSGEKIIVKKGAILDGTPEIKSGLNIYYSIVIFKNAFKVEDILENGLLNRDDVLYAGKWIYDGRVPYIYEQESEDKEPVISESIKVTAKGKFHNGNESNRGVVLEKDGYYYANEMDSNRNYKL